MQRWHALVLVALLCLLPLSGMVVASPHQQSSPLDACKDLAFSTEEDFITQGPVPNDGNPRISDGDLLGSNHTVCLRNRQLLEAWGTTPDLGLDAVDVLQIEGKLIAFSTELHDPQKRFREGDLLVTNGLHIPNRALLARFQVSRDLGLDALHFVGSQEKIIAFVVDNAQMTGNDWLNGVLQEKLQAYAIDIWFSTEGTELAAATTPILDGHLLSAGKGTVIAAQPNLLPTSVAAGIPTRGVDFGLDAATAPRSEGEKLVRFSTSLLHTRQPPFTDGDVLRLGSGVEIPHTDLVKPFEPYADFLGLDALYMRFAPQENRYLPVILFRNRPVP